jgi:hypothetical protein
LRRRKTTWLFKLGDNLVTATRIYICQHERIEETSSLGNRGHTATDPTSTNDENVCHKNLIAFLVIARVQQHIHSTVVLSSKKP